MKIGIYDPYLDDLGGGEKYMMTIAECLSKNHDVSIFWDNQKDLDGLLQRFSLDLSKVSLKKNIFSSNVGFREKILETKKYDVIVFLSDGSIPLSLSKKLFIHVQQPLEGLSLLSIKNKIKLARVTAVFYNSEFTKSFNDNKLQGVKSTVIYPPVYLMPKDLKKENIILHVGRFRVKNVGLEDFKKQNIMVDAFKKMVDQKINKNWKLVIAASVKKEDEEKFEILRNSAKGYPIEFLINKSNDNLWDIYNKAKIYWHASGFGEDLDKHPEYAEHFGISTVEAMGAGAVPVVINAGGQTEIITDGENGYLWNTLDDLQKMTVKLMDNSKLLQEMSDNARIRAKDFSKEKFYQAVNQLIEQ